MAAAARAWLLFGTPYMPGINGAYYLVQARALLERGALGIPDLPLTFYLHAALAWGLASVSGVAATDAIVWSVKLCDAALPPLVAWPVFVLVRQWATARDQGDAVPLAAAALSCFAWPWFRIVSDLQKNSLALAGLAMLALLLHRWLRAPTPRRGAAVLGCLLLLGLTHVGVLGAAVVLLAAATLVFAFREGVAGWRQVLPGVGVAGLLVAFVATLVLWQFDPARIHRLITAFTNPAVFSADGKQMPVAPGGGMDALRGLPALAFALTVVPGLFVVWRRRKGQSAADAALVAGAALTVLALTGPWWSTDKAMRFYLIALVPAILVLAFTLLHLTSGRLRGGIVGAVLIGAAGSAVPMLERGGSPILSPAAMMELQSLATHVQRPDRTLVCAQHGVEWWTAWWLRTRIAQASALKADDWQHYEAVLLLEIKSGLQALPGPGGGGPPRLGPDGGRLPGPGGAESSGPGPGPPSALPPPPTEGANPPTSAPIPPDAEVLHDGPCITLVRIGGPPAGGSVISWP
jgi:hypothetical protein